MCQENEDFTTVVAIIYLKKKPTHPDALLWTINAAFFMQLLFGIRAKVQQHRTLNVPQILNS